MASEYDQHVKGVCAQCGAVVADDRRYARPFVEVTRPPNDWREAIVAKLCECCWEPRDPRATIAREAADYAAREPEAPEAPEADDLSDDYGADEPDEDAITTTDYRVFYQYGKPVLRIEDGADVEAALRAYCDRVKFWPDAWFISDHGNAHRIEFYS